MAQTHVLLKQAYGTAYTHTHTGRSTANDPRVLHITTAGFNEGNEGILGKRCENDETPLFSLFTPPTCTNNTFSLQPVSGAPLEYGEEAGA